MSNKRVTKKHLTPVGQDFFALGASTSTASNQMKLPAKRTEPFHSPIIMSPKRSKLSAPSQSISQQIGSSMPSSSMQASKLARSMNQSWEDKAIIVPAIELKDRILKLDSELKADSEEMIERLLCGAVKQLREQKTKPDPCLIFTLLYLTKIRPLFFCSSVIVEAFGSLLKREHLLHFKTKQNNYVPILIVNLFFHAFHDENSWPEIFIKLYVEDSLGERIWVDNEECKEFVDIIVSSFRTRLPPKSMLQTSDVMNPTKTSIESSTSATITSMNEDSLGDESCSSSTSIYIDSSSSLQSITSRYLENEDKMINYVYEIINENLNRRQNVNDYSRNMLKLLIATSGLRNVRLLVAQKLEHWFQNPKLSRPAQDLLLTVFLNCDGKDYETLNYLFKMRLKSKPFINHFILCFKELLNQKNDTFEVVMKILLTNENSGIKNMNNIHLLSIMFQINPQDATILMAKFFFSMICLKDDQLKMLRNLLREIVRAMKSDSMDYSLFIKSLIEESKIFMVHQQFDMILFGKILFQIIDLATMVILLSVNQNRDSFVRLDRKEMTRNFQLKFASIQYYCIEWISTMGFRKFLFQDRESFNRVLKKIMLLDMVESCSCFDNWLPDNERAIVFRYATERLPFLEGTLKSILTLAFDPETPFDRHEACVCIFNLITRAAINFDGDLNYPVLLFNDINIIDPLFECCIYSYPNTEFPPNYVPPRFAIMDRYWKVWLMLLIIVAHNPKSFGQHSWNKYPTLQALIEMAITNDFQFPPKTMDNEEFINQMIRLNQSERSEILEFENYLATDNEVTETSSYLLSSLITFEPYAMPRRPPDNFKQFCSNYRLCYLLCRIRNPDFLLRIIEKQRMVSNPQAYLSSMNWLADLVESNENNYGFLPVQCLSEYLMKQIAEEYAMSLGISFSNNYDQTLSKADKAKRKEKRPKKLIRLILFFQNDFAQTPKTQLSESFQYFLGNLRSPQSNVRLFAYKALHLIVTFSDEKSFAPILQDENGLALFLNLSDEIPSSSSYPDWLRHENLKNFCNSNQQTQLMCSFLAQALAEESNPSLIKEYLKFLSQNSINNDCVEQISSLLLMKPRIVDHFLIYAEPELKENFISSLSKIYSDFWLKTLKHSEDGSLALNLSNNMVYLKFRSKSNPIPINYDVLNAIILFLSFHQINEEIFEKYFFEKPAFKTFKDIDRLHSISPIAESLVPRILQSETLEIIDLVLSNFKPEFFIQVLITGYGLSKQSLRKILALLDDSQKLKFKLSDCEQGRLIKMLEMFWDNDIDSGHKFAKQYLNFNYAESMNEDEDVLSEKTEDLSEDDGMTVPELKKIKYILLDGKLSPRIYNHIASQLLSENKSHNFTKKFLSLFMESKNKYKKLILEGIFDPFFLMIFGFISKNRDLIVEFEQDLIKVKKFLQSFNNDYFRAENLWEPFENCSTDVLKETNQTTTKRKGSNLAKKKKRVSAKKVGLPCSVPFNLMINLNPDDWCDIYIDQSIENFSFFQNDRLLMLIFSENRPFFLSKLLHNTNFSTMCKCIDFLLNDDSIKKLNPTAALDFLRICTESPKLYIGREFDSPKEIQYENVLNLNPEQIKNLIRIVIIEENIENRIEMIRRICCLDQVGIRTVNKFLKELEYQGHEMSKFSTDLQIRLYLQIPKMQINHSTLNDEQIKFIMTQTCTLDKTIHNLLTSFLHKKSISSPNFRFWEYFLSKITIDHPILFLRQLPMIAELLSSKIIHRNYEIFKNHNLPRIYDTLLKILHLSKPFVWNKNVQGFESILQIYIETFWMYCRIPRQKEPNIELSPTIVQFLRMIDDWRKYDSDRSMQWIGRNKNFLHDLSMVYQTQSNLFMGIISGSPLIDDVPEAIRRILNSLVSSNGSNDFTQRYLIELKSVMERYPRNELQSINIVKNYYHNPLYSQIAFEITLKILSVNPRLIEFIIEQYLKCLRSHSNIVVKTALNFLPDLMIFAQNDRYLILSEVFDLALEANNDAATSLVNVFKALNTQSGC
ncbi:Integrator complex subunit 1 [Sarcoptes scabiei]|uniref:Integrator complex subunit 1 n=2 Tax=Sarcoptes scabiei TaxID=52283 RepID=A0A834R3M9_SARSC|nr:Integrator complex subunit 1 [Sarcoptes scabiei]